MGTQALVVAILLSVCNGKQYMHKACHSSDNGTKGCTVYHKTANCTTGVINIVSAGNGKKCCREMGRAASGDIERKLIEECVNKTYCNFTSVTSGVLLVQYTCAATSVYTATTEVATMTVTPVPNSDLHSPSSRGEQSYIVGISIVSILAMCSVAVLIVVVCKRRKRRQPSTSPDVYELERNTRMDIHEAAVIYDEPDEIKDEQDHEYDRTTIAMNLKRDENTTYDMVSSSANNKHIMMGENNVYDLATSLPE